MAAFEIWDIVKLPWPYAGQPAKERRPALVIAAGELQALNGLLWVAMITSAENRGWPDDVGISDLDGAGLPAPSIVRPAKIATVDARDAQRLGTSSIVDREAVAAGLRRIIGVVLDRSGERSI